MSAPSDPRSPAGSAVPAAPASQTLSGQRFLAAGWLVALASTAASVLLAISAWPASPGAGMVPAWALTVALAVSLAGPAVLVVTLVGAARRERRDADADLHRALRRRQATRRLLDLLPVAVALADPRSSRALLNAPMAHLLRVDPALAPDCALDWAGLVAAEDGPAWRAAVDSAHRTGETQWLRCTMALDGGWRAALVQIAAVALEDEPTLAVSVTPLDTDAGLAQQAVLQLRDLLELAESEKWRFGQAVHDELGQRLSGMAFFAKALQRKLEAAHAAEAEDAGWLNGLANESMSVARGLARGLVPVGSDDPAAIEAALLDVCETAARAFGITYELDVDPRFDPGGAAQANHMYHAVQELVTNACRHGGAKRLTITIEARAGGQRVRVHNDGQPLAGSTAVAGMGIKGVRSRVAYLGGRFWLGNDEQGGVLATIDLPPAPGAGARSS